MNANDFRFDDVMRPPEPVDCNPASAMRRIYPWITYDAAPREEEADIPNVVEAEES